MKTLTKEKKEKENVLIDLELINLKMCLCCNIRRLKGR
jgi:hypothetical protein